MGVPWGTVGPALGVAVAPLGAWLVARRATSGNVAHSDARTVFDAQTKLSDFYRDDAQEWRARADHCEAEADRVQALLDAAKAQLAEAQTQLRHLTEEVAKLRTEIAALRKLQTRPKRQA